MVKILASDAQESRQQLYALESVSKEQREQINDLTSKNAELVVTMAELKKEVDNLNELKFALKVVIWFGGLCNL